MNCSTRLTKALLFAVLIAGCGVPTQEEGTPKTEDTTGVSPVVTETVSPQPEPVVLSISPEQSIEQPTIAFQEQKQDMTLEKDTIYVSVFHKSDSDSVFVQKKRYHIVQNKKMKAINDTIKSIDEKFDKIEEKIRQYKK